MKITRVRGDTYADQFTITMRKDGTAADLTGCSFMLTVSSVQSPTTDSTKLYQIVGSVTDPTKGIVSFAPSAVQADRVGIFYFDVQLTDATGAVRTLVLDSYTYTQDITK